MLFYIVKTTKVSFLSQVLYTTSFQVSEVSGGKVSISQVCVHNITGNIHSFIHLVVMANRLCRLIDVKKKKKNCDLPQAILMWAVIEKFKKDKMYLHNMASNKINSIAFTARYSTS